MRPVKASRPLCSAGGAFLPQDRTTRRMYYRVWRLCKCGSGQRRKMLFDVYGSPGNHQRFDVVKDPKHQALVLLQRAQGQFHRRWHRLRRRL